ncbi:MULTISPECIES: LLM class flavin-dependent oxidoreductase [unclassified Curtobacterium]|uniref:LLM class flavin-dependent oxidoreductase n=1 Tax=unclassified Curtobacterium TaxID=257496 RepID=UPI000DA9AC22|nr:MULTISPECIES: LLM class flavin-dependent oxidoreductase [unclassified Curtobacterium]PZE25643.1 alkanesulfonate monooxygenase [Curtobacterium sp. MCBD17_028]PZE78487.1 alkanesulfonate monooxygenase [Curtobacterium sp. MCBD17_019]WIE55339.1 LLM class flavin-dependent oxidoreductase [Curtobacterium sp. MCBD17_003]
MELGYWTPVYGGFLRNVGDEGMPATWDYIRRVSRQAEDLGFTTTLVPELYLNDRKGVEAPSLEAWSLSTAILAATERLRVMTAVRAGFHLPTVIAKAAATITDIAGGDRFALNVVAAWWAEEARQYGGVFAPHDRRYEQAEEFVDVLRALWTELPATRRGSFYDVVDAVLSPKPAVPPRVFAGGESDAGRESIAGFADAYVTHGGTVEELREKVADVNARRERLQGAPFAEIGMAAYVIVRETEAEARAELERITTVDPASPGYASFEEFRANSNLDVELSRREYSVGTRGLRPDLVGTPEQVAERILAFADAGVTLLLVQASPLHEELPRIARDVLPLVQAGSPRLALT